MHTEAQLLEQQSLVLDDAGLGFEVLLAHIVHRSHWSARGRGER